MRTLLILIFVLVFLTCNSDKSDNIVVVPDIYDWEQLTNKPAILEYISPVYPEALRRANITGTVLVEVIIEKTGRVDSVRVIESSGNVIFDFISSESAKTFVFEVPKVNGDSVRVIARIPFKFELNQ